MKSTRTQLNSTDLTRTELWTEFIVVVVANVIFDFLFKVAADTIRYEMLFQRALQSRHEST